MKNLLLLTLLTTFATASYPSESFVDSHDPVTYFYPNSNFFSLSLRLVESFHSPSFAPFPNERAVKLMILDESLAMDSILYGLRAEVLAELSTINATLDYCQVRIANNTILGFEARGSQEWDFTQCANEGIIGIIGFNINYTVGPREGIVRVSLTHLTKPRSLDIRYVEYEKL